MLSPMFPDLVNSEMYENIYYLQLRKFGYFKNNTSLIFLNLIFCNGKPFNLCLN